MTIALVTSTTGAVGSARTNTTITGPSGIVAGNALLAHVVTSINTSAITPATPAGWTQIASQGAYDYTGWFVRMTSYTKLAVGTEAGASITFTHASCDCQGYMGRWSGVRKSSSFIGNTSANAGNSMTTTMTGINMQSVESALVMIATDWSWGTPQTQPAGMTEFIDSGPMEGAYLLPGAAGATGNKTFTNSNTLAAQAFLACAIELLPDVIPRSLNINQAVKRAAYW